ncbi:predicted protein [Histoplasma capsulatum H143]|uniref:Uncharacterized protein n=1 Tax=Ajellomyces capsulatus (strain H143) TaxID=544712 RepID=C6HF37_AJECH|nr:predicted protein [Histoplasma capsulatum H143]
MKIGQPAPEVTWEDPSATSTRPGGVSSPPPGCTQAFESLQVSPHDGLVPVTAIKTLLSQYLNFSEWTKGFDSWEDYDLSSLKPLPANQLAAASVQLMLVTIAALSFKSIQPSNLRWLFVSPEGVSFLQSAIFPPAVLPKGPTPWQVEDLTIQSFCSKEGGVLVIPGTKNKIESDGPEKANISSAGNSMCPPTPSSLSLSFALVLLFLSST